jgi:hypothetical protein
MAKELIGMTDIPSKFFFCHKYKYKNKQNDNIFNDVFIHRDQEQFDWYQRYAGIRDIINQV